MKLLESDLNEILDRLRETDYFSRLSGSRILLTGGCGFLGQYFTQLFLRMNREKLVEKPIEVVVVDNFISSDSKTSIIADPRVTYYSKDVSSMTPEFLSSEGPFDYVLYAAGIASPQYYMKYPMTTIKIVTQGLQNVIDYATRNELRSLVFFSSSEIYGDPDPKMVPTPETYKGSVSCLGDRACYDESKRLGETMCRVAWQELEIPTRIIRPFNVYGPGSMENDYRALPNFVSRYLSGTPISIYGTGEQTRTFCYVTDAIFGFFRVMMDGENGEPYNVGNPNPEISVLQLLNRIQDVTGHEIEHRVIPHPADYPADEPNRRCPDIRKVSILGYAPRVSIDSGLKRFIDWARDMGWGKINDA